MAQPSALPYDPVWTEPINLSHSGSTSNPQLIIDSAGRFDAIWVDQFNGYMTASSFDGNNWSKPVPVNFPFGIKDGSPMLVSDSEGYVHAFWIDSTNALFYSRVLADEFSTGTSWEERKKLAEPAVDFSVVIDGKGIIHLAYVRILSTEELPSGIYYRTSKDNGANWYTSRALYQSQYFRSLKPEEAYVKLATSGDGSVYVVWDNRPLKLIFFSKSTDGGNSWTDPKILKSPAVEDGNNIPFGVNIAVNGNDMLITWQSGQPNANCDQYSQWSTDNGNSWSTPLLVMQSKFGCSPESKLFALQDGLILLIANMENQPASLAWNGFQWSNRQNILTSFTDPDTYNSINYRGQQTILTGSTQLYVVGYDDGGIGDTWLTSRSLESILDWFPNPSDWSKPEVISTTPSEISSISIAVDGTDQFHILWIQSDQNNGKKISSIYYSKWDGILWTQPQAIYTATQGDISHLDTAVDGERLLVVWSEGLNDQILYSWSNTGTAQNPSEWATPLQLSTTRFTGKSPKILVGNSGIVYVAYSKPINEDRGIYIVKSTDEGENWSDPHQVFNAEAAGWDIADSPELATDQNGSVNVVWVKKSFPVDGHLLALYTSQSGDQGSTWSNPSVVEEGDLTWSQISGIHSSNLYRIWQEVDISTQLVDWYQFSIDGGATWSLP
ncbi:MAG: sialidase family protein, partial [Anaerolineales bacterium]